VNVSIELCCGSGMFISDPRSDPSPSRIPDQKGTGSRIRIRNTALSYSIYVHFSMIESKSNMVIDFYCAEKSMVEYSGKMEPLATKGLGKIINFFTELYNSNHNCMVCVMFHRTRSFHWIHGISVDFISLKNDENVPSKST
jgi:hypothetical protein